MYDHNSNQDKFISLEREREGIVVTYSAIGGINVEENKDHIKRKIFSLQTAKKINEDLELPAEFIQKLIEAFEEYYFSFLEINPLVVVNGDVHILDLAVEVDDAAEFFVKGVWDRKDYIDTSVGKKTEEEKNIEILAQDSPASLKLNVFNPDGGIFLLLSGGGASIALADEVYNQGFGKELANYGEYSGNPNEEETYTYTKNILSLLLKSHATRKVLIIAGGVANFTDIRKTFKGVIRALAEKAQDMRAQHIKVFVRRGGPYQKQGLQHMKEFLEKEELYGYVAGPEMVLTDIVKKAIEQIELT
jgi:ATP-citrate lyase beta-subunit